MLGRFVEADSLLILPALDERQQTRVGCAFVQGIEDIACLRTGLLHKLPGGSLELLDLIHLYQHLGHDFYHFSSLLSSASFSRYFKIILEDNLKLNKYALFGNYEKIAVWTYYPRRQ